MQVPAPDAARHAAVNPWAETSPTPVTQTQQQGCQRRPGPPAAPWAARAMAWHWPQDSRWIVPTCQQCWSRRRVQTAYVPDRLRSHTVSMLSLPLS